MTQDTRKDRRVKIVSLNVRYKSATVDEFIENHAHDVSRGGIFIKTANPFPPGTLLKFEIRLASDQAVIAGVGRVVWKRDAGASNGDRPAGMGVKFIKIDEPSRAVVDKLMNTRSDAGISFEVNDGTTSPPEQASLPSGAPAKTTDPPITRSSPPPVAVAKTAGATAAAVPERPANTRKATMVGIGTASVAPPPGNRPSSMPPRPNPHPSAPPAPPRPSAGGSMFPRAAFEKEVPPKEEQTVMRQAAELLEDALREAGGSIDEIGHNPLFAGSPGTVSGSPPKPAPAAGAEVEPALTETAKRAPSQPVAAEPAVRKTPTPAAGRPPQERPSGARPAAGVRASAPAAPAKEPEKAKGAGGGVLVAIALVAAAAVAGVLLFRDRLFGESGAPASPDTAASMAKAAPTTEPTPSASPSVTASAGPPSAASVEAPVASNAPSTASPTASSAASPAVPAGRAAATASGPSTAAATTAPPAPRPPRVFVKPTAKPAEPKPTETATPEPTASASAPAPAETTTATAAETAPTPSASAAPAKSAAPAPAKPKSSKPSDDNPY